MQEFTQFVVQHWALWLALVVLLALIIRHETSSQAGGVRFLSPQQVTQYINHENGVVVDIREKEAFSSGHILNAMHIPFSELDAKLKKLQKYKSKPIILACATGQQVARFGARLRKEGFEKVFSLKGGIQAWRKESMPLVSKAGK